MAVTLQYNLTVPTVHTFLCRYVKAAHADRVMVQLACYLAELSLQEYSSTKFLPSVIAASAIYLSRKALKRYPWSPTLLKYTQLDEPDFAECASDMYSYASKTMAKTSENAVFKKYSNLKFGAVAKISLVA